MSIVVQHEKRRKEILEKALTVFVNDGFHDTTFQRIADRCSITRTTLYLYFKNKQEIFNYSIKQMLAKFEEKINIIRVDASFDSVEKITRVMLDIFKMLEQNRRLLSVVLDYLLHLPKNENNPEQRIRRRTVRLRHILSFIVIEGIKAGELKKVKIKVVYDYLYSIIIAAIFHLTVFKKKNLDELKEMTIFSVKQFAA